MKWKVVGAEEEEEEEEDEEEEEEEEVLLLVSPPRWVELSTGTARMEQFLESIMVEKFSTMVVPVTVWMISAWVLSLLRSDSMEMFSGSENLTQVRLRE